MKYSVALCTYNGSLFIEEQLNSIIKQTLRPHEIIVCDDTSTDKTVDIVIKFRNSNPEMSFKIIRNVNNLGVIKNYENCIGNCSGDFIFLCDQDDVWDLSRVEKVASFIKKRKINPDECHFIFNDLHVINEHGLKIESAFFQSNLQLYIENPHISSIRLLTKNWVPGCTCLISRGLRNMSLPFPNAIHMHDHWLFLLASHYGTVHFLNEKLIQYRQHPNNTIGTGSHLQRITKNIFNLSYFSRVLSGIKIKLFQLDSLIERGKIRNQVSHWRNLDSYNYCLQNFSWVQLFVLIVRERLFGLGAMPWVFSFISLFLTKFTDSRLPK